MTEDARPVAGEWLYRTAQQIGVNFSERTIDLVVMPYDEEALVHYNGRMVYERVAPGSFDGIEKRANRVRVNRDHDLRRTVGRALSFHPEDPRGLIATVKISRTPLGDETLELANDESLDASAGFAPMPGGTHWADRDHVQYSRCWLGHVAMTPEPAYEGAQVLAVRSADEPAPPAAVKVATPNLDIVRGWILERRYAQI
jgi:HK97 family phage prohead protease